MATITKVDNQILTVNGQLIKNKDIVDDIAFTLDGQRRERVVNNQGRIIGVTDKGNDVAEMELKLVATSQADKLLNEMYQVSAAASNLIVTYKKHISNPDTGTEEVTQVLTNATIETRQRGNSMESDVTYKFSGNLTERFQ